MLYSSITNNLGIATYTYTSTHTPLSSTCKSVYNGDSTFNNSTSGNVIISKLGNTVYWDGGVTNDKNINYTKKNLTVTVNDTSTNLQGNERSDYGYYYFTNTFTTGFKIEYDYITSTYPNCFIHIGGVTLTSDSDDLDGKIKIINYNNTIKFYKDDVLTSTNTTTSTSFNIDFGVYYSKTCNFKNFKITQY